MDQSTEHMNAIALNAVAKIALVGLDSARPDHSTVLTRSTMPEDMILPIMEDFKPSSPYYAELRPRLPSKLPPPGQGELKATLGTYIGHGHSSIVYALDNVTLSGSPSNVYIPPLVVKIARLNRVTSLMREAWFYDEMEVLQGVSLARCYGYFTMRLDEGPLKEEQRKMEHTYPNDDRREMNPALAWDRATGPLHQLLEDQSRRTDLLAVIVLERLGSPLPLELPVSQETQDDIVDVYRDIAHMLVINTAGVRLPNILQAPQTPPGLPSLESPFSHRIHSWRAIDLEIALKTNTSVNGIQLNHECELVNVWEEAAYVNDEEYDGYDSTSAESGDDASSDQSFVL